MIAIIKHICESIYASNLKWDDYLYLGKKDKDGRMFGKSDVSERDYDYIGITDNKGNYFYIRHKDDEIIPKTSAPLRTSCTPNKESAPTCRLVAILHNYPDKYNLDNVITAELENVDFSTYTGFENKIRVEVTSSLLNPFSVIEEESNGKKKSFDHKMTIIAIDFTLFYQIELNKCLNLDCGSINNKSNGSL
jgi:hypothetical protein